MILVLFENLFFYNFLNNFSKNENFILISFIFVGIIFVLKNLFIMFYNFFYQNLIVKHQKDSLTIFINII